MSRGQDGKPRVIDNWHEAGREAAVNEIMELIGVMLMEDRSSGEIVHAVISYGVGVIALRSVRYASF